MSWRRFRSFCIVPGIGTLSLASPNPCVSGWGQRYVFLLASPNPWCQGGGSSGLLCSLRGSQDPGGVFTGSEADVASGAVPPVLRLGHNHYHLGC
jgi:hypothetical protein